MMRMKMEYKTARGGEYESRKWVKLMSIRKRKRMRVRKRKRVRMTLKGRRELVSDEGRVSEILGR